MPEMNNLSVDQTLLTITTSETNNLRVEQQIRIVRKCQNINHHHYKSSYYKLRSKVLLDRFPLLLCISSPLGRLHSPRVLSLLDTFNLYLT